MDGKGLAKTRTSNISPAISCIHDWACELSA